MMPHKSIDAGILSLAPELIEAISENLDSQSIKQFRLTCKALAELLNNAVLRRITVDITRSNFEKGLSKLAVLSKAKHAACTGTRELFIGSLSPSYDPNYQGPSWKYIDGEWKSETPPEDPPEIASAEQEIAKCLYDAIASFKGVQCVTWTPRGKDSEQMQHSVLRALLTLPNLRRLQVSLYSCKIPVELESFKFLQEISIEETSALHQEAILDSLAKLVANNSNITAIDLLSNWGYRQPNRGSQSLHQLFKYYPQSAPPLRLRHLGLKYCLMRLDEITLPHLKNLTSIDLTSIEDPYSPTQYFSNPDEEEQRAAVYAMNKQYGSRIEDVWNILRTSGIHLRDITLDVVTHSFIDYLTSYKGMRKLYLSPGGFNNGASSDEMAKRFFGEAFPIHASSLENLHVVPRYEGLWCFGSHNLDLISKCTHLKTMRLGVMSSQLGLTWHDDDDDDDGPVPNPNPNAVKLMVDMAVTSMPHIEGIHISGANLEELRWARCGNPAMTHFTYVNEKLEKSVLEYRAPLSCTWLPALRITNTGRRTFVDNLTYSAATGDPTNSEEPLRYINTTPPVDSMNVDW